MRLPELSPRAYRYIVAATLASLVFIMVTGAAVRLTDSGLGCSTWPSCEPDSFTPRSASDTHGMVEWVNRLITGSVGLFTLAAVVGARARRPYRDDLFRWSLGLPAWVFANALVGALVVWLHLSPASVIGHFVLSLAAVWNAVVLYERAGEEPAPDGSRRLLATGTVVAACRLLLVAAGLVIMTGTLVTGSGPHAGDERADRLDLALDDVVRIHGAAMILFLGVALTVLWMAHDGDADSRVVRSPPPVARGARGPGGHRLLAVLHRRAGSAGGLPRLRRGAGLDRRAAGVVLALGARQRSGFRRSSRRDLPIGDRGRWRRPGRRYPADGRARIGTMPIAGPPLQVAPVETDQPVGDTAVDPDRPWVVIVWNDPINLMSYVTYVLQKLFGYPLEVAEKLMLQVHYEGRAVVSNGPREKAELDVFRLHEHGLWATMQQD